MAAVQIVDRGGPVLERAKIVLSFYGAGWKTGEFTTADARGSFEAALASPYLSSLVQYRGIRRAEIVFSIEDLTDVGALGPDPRKFVAGNIWLVADEDVRNIARVAERARPARENEEVFYLAVISQNPIPIVPTEPNASGYHNVFEEDGRRIVYGVLLNQSANSAKDTWRYLPGIFTHELVEACTDPDVRTGYKVNNLPEGTEGDELCDMVDNRTIQLRGLENEVTLAGYWSELEGKVVAPTMYSLRVALGKRATEATPSVRAAIQGTSVRNAILAGCNP